jgi:hypothetical protein
MRHLSSSLLLISFIFLVSNGLISCKDTQTNSSTMIVFPDSNVSFVNHVGKLFQQKCTSAPCHGGDAPASGLNLEYPSYTALINHMPTLIIPRDTNCLLIERLDGRLPPMPPPNFPQLNSNQISGIKKWVKEGALYN